MLSLGVAVLVALTALPPSVLGGGAEATFAAGARPALCRADGPQSPWARVERPPGGCDVQRLLDRNDSRALAFLAAAAVLNARTPAAAVCRALLPSDRRALPSPFHLRI